MSGKPSNQSDEVATILLVDDHPIVRRGFAALIAQEPGLSVCGEAEDAATALERITATGPSMVVIDISLPDGSGLELIKQIKARYPETRMLVISMHDESLFAERALRAGALGYLNKSEAPEQFIKAIHQVLRGEIYLSGGMTSRMLRQIVVGGDCEGSPVENLSDRELEVFELLGGGLTISQIAERLHRSVKTVEAHRERIKRKLELKSSAELTRHAFLWLQENS